MTLEDVTERLALEIQIADRLRDLDLEELRALLVALKAPRIRRAAGRPW